MVVSPFPRITKVLKVKPGVLHVCFDTGDVRQLALKRYARKGTVFERLADPKYADKVHIVERGRALCWPGGVDFCADAILLKAKAVPPLLVEVKLCCAKPRTPSPLHEAPLPRAASGGSPCTSFTHGAPAKKPAAYPKTASLPVRSTPKNAASGAKVVVTRAKKASKTKKG